MAEVEDWLTLERIAMSRFVKFALFDNRPYWEGRDPALFMERAIRAFACGHCYDLAHAAALASGLPIAIARRRGEIGPAIVHAAVYDPATQIGADILGARPFAAIAKELESAVGRLSLSLEAADDECADEEMDELAAGIPWLPRRLDARSTEFGRVVEIIEAMPAAAF